jgi:hypothetical protein
MSTPDSLEALRRANPRAKAGFAEAVAATAATVRTEIGERAYAPESHGSDRSRRLAGISAAAASVAAAAVAAILFVGSPGGGPGVEDAAAAFRQAASLTAAEAERSGTAVVRVTHGGELWAAKTVRWHGGDIAISAEAPVRRGRPGSGLLVVDGVLYGIEDGRWAELGSVNSIDPDSGTTPDEHLAAVREDVGGRTLRRITGNMTGPATSPLADGSTVYSGSVAAGSIARETGFKEGKAIRVLPFGYVAHGEAADPSSRLDVAVTVGSDGIVRTVAVSWGAGSSAWTYTVAYNRLGSTPALAAPENPRPFGRRR